MKKSTSSIFYKLNILCFSKYLFFFLAIPYCSLAQLNPNTLLPNVMPSNPQAFQFMKYGEIPVQQYTGTPNITVPIYTIETKALSIPITLNYHANGIKVNEESSWVGLGWNLSTDMELVQTVQGLDDFGRFQHRSLPNFNCMISDQASGLSGTGVMSTCGPFYLGLNDDWNDLHPDCFFDTHFMASMWDSEPDYFYFSAIGYSGKFVLDWNTEQFVCLSNKNVKIESNYLANNGSSNEPSVFIITVADGHRFVFTLKESTVINYSNTIDPINGVIPANIDTRGEKSSRVYKLTQIMTTKADVIDFEYENSQNLINGGNVDAVSKNFPYINLVDRTEKASGAVTNIIDQQPNSLTAAAPATYTPTYLTSYTATQQTYSYLKKISYNGMNIEFLTSSRLDLKEAKKLDRINVSERGTSKVFLFNYDYFTGNTNGNNWDSFLTYGSVNPYTCDKTSDEINKRLKLVSFNELGENPYIFDYNGQSLPKKTSYAIDYWGFYNGNDVNISFFPNIYKFNIERDNPFYYNYQTNDNTPIIDFCKAATLEKITYPTGGSDVFEYELNSFTNYKVPSPSQGTPVNINLSTHTPANSYPLTQKGVLIEGGNTIFNVSGLLSTHGCYPQYPNAYSDCYFKVVHFKKELMDYIKADTNLSAHLAYYGITYVLGADLHFLDGVAPNNQYQSLYNQYLDIPGIYIRKTVNVNDDEFVTNKKINLTEGIAIFSVSGGCGIYDPTGGNAPYIANWSQSSFNISYNEYKPLNDGNTYYGAGLRIKSITALPNINLAPTVAAFKKTYSYEGGKLMTPFLFFNQTPLQYKDSRPIAINPPPNGCEAEMDLKKFALQIEFDKFTKNPNDAQAEKVKYALSDLKSVLCSNNEGDSVLWITVKDFNGYRNELHSQSFIQPSTSASGRYVGYDKVTEQYVDSNNTATTSTTGIGKIDSYYTNNQDIGASTSPTGGGFYTEINIPLMIHYPENGLLIESDVYDNANTKKKQVTNTYNFVRENCLWGMKTLTTVITEYFDFTGPHKKKNYLVGAYPMIAGKTLLIQTEEKNFYNWSMVFNGYDVSNVTKYDYDSHNQVSKITESNSKGDLIEKYNSYPYDNTAQTDFIEMVNRNMLTPVIESRTNYNGNTISLEQTSYKGINTPNPNNYFQSTYAVDKIKYCKSGDYVDLENVVSFHNYDQYSNPAEVSKRDGTRISYIWGYNGKYPIAKIENASQPTNDNATQGFTIIDSNLSQAAINKSNTGTEAELLSALSDLRHSLPNAMVTTCTYIPLVGVSTITDPKGSVMTYTYDSVGRLQYVKDDQNNILSEYEYNYKSQN